MCLIMSPIRAVSGPLKDFSGSEEASRAVLAKAQGFLLVLIQANRPAFRYCLGVAKASSHMTPNMLFRPLRLVKSPWKEFSKGGMQVGHVSKSSTLVELTILH